ncbi:response regulator transcription factor [Butyricicoccus sp.]|uniref:response regulator transcription factor n=1 Tax=Butyricicoccus sp. TaxID=2049021 RepID=UPI003F18ACBC
MDTRTVMICDDKEAVHESLTRFLHEDGIEVISVYDGEAALEALSRHPVDLIILDVMLPRINGTDVCRTIRRSSDIPIIFLSARSEEIDRIIGLELGGDDYVTKPFSPREVALRVRKILSRTSAAPARPATQMLRYAELSVNPDTMEVFVGEQKLDMTAKEVHLLSYLIRNAQKVLNREQILKAVWGYDYYGDTRAVDAVVKRLRKKLPTENVHFSIQSIYGVGYRLGGQV